jgi:hypothetical protein
MDFNALGPWQFLTYCIIRVISVLSWMHAKTTEGMATEDLGNYHDCVGSVFVK